jgi:hypothetical protein
MPNSSNSDNAATNAVNSDQPFRFHSTVNTFRQRFPDATIAMFGFYIESLKTCATAEWLAVYRTLRSLTTSSGSRHYSTTDPEELNHAIEWIKSSPAIPSEALAMRPWLLERCLEALGRSLAAFDAVRGTMERLDLALRLWATVQPLRHTNSISADFLHSALHVAMVVNEEAAAALLAARVSYNCLSAAVAPEWTDGASSPFPRHGHSQTAVVLYTAGQPNFKTSNGCTDQQGESQMESDGDSDTDGGVPL